MNRSSLLVLIFAILVFPSGFAANLLAADNSITDAELTPEQIFEQRLMPIFHSPNPSSCTQCHLSGVDLKNYILPSAPKTFVNLREQGLIDIDNPEDSKILKFIAMAPDEYEPLTPKIHPKLRQAEFDAFKTWILAAVKDQRYLEIPPMPAEETAGPKFPVEVIRHSRIDSLVDSFERNIWNLRFRCANCHHPGGEKFAKWSKDHGEDTMGWLKAGGPVESMRYLMTSDLIDLDNPERSELLLKPLDEIDHEGGQKMRRGDTDYVAFLSWIQDFAAVRKGEYQTAADLPAGPEMNGTEIWLRITGMPPRRVNDSGLLAVHSRMDNGEWSEAPVAVASGTVINNPRFGVMLQGFLMIDRPADNRQLPPGNYQIRLYLDEGERASTQWSEAIANAELLGAAQVRANWRSGFRGATVVDAGRFKRARP